MEVSVLLHKFQSLPEEGKRELADFIEFLTFRYRKKDRKKENTFSFDWEGGIKELKEKSVDLQHEANKWRSI